MIIRDLVFKIRAPTCTMVARDTKFVLARRTKMRIRKNLKKTTLTKTR